MHFVCINVIGVHVGCIVCAACVHQVSMLPFAEQCYKDPMHGNEHCNSMLTVKCSVIKLQNFGEELNLSSGVFITRLKTRFLGLCDSSSVQHLTLLTLGNQILDGLEVIDKEVRTKKKTHGQPIGDANDAAKIWTGPVCRCIGVGLLGVLLDLHERV